MNSVRVRLAPGLALAIAVLVVLALGPGLTPAGWALGLAFDAATLILLDRGLTRAGARAPGPADQVTLTRAALVGGVAALVAGSFTGDVPVLLLTALAAVALALDAVDGWLARRSRTASAVGARFDMEVDAFLILVLSLYVAMELGAWVLLIGVARYLLMAAGSLWPWLRGPSPTRYWAKVVAAVQGVVLTVMVLGVMPRPVETVLTLVSLGLLVESFGHQVLWLARHRSAGTDAPVPVSIGLDPRTTFARVSTIAAVAVVWVGLAWPYQLTRLSVATFVQIPIEGLVLVAAALLLPRLPRVLLAATAGSILGLLVLLKALDMGYYAELDRAFNPLIEWSSLGPGVGVLRDSVGPVWAYLAVAGAVLLAVAVMALAAWSAVRVARLGAAHRRASAWVVGALALGWLLSLTVGLDVAPHTPVASRSTTSFAVTEVRNVAAAERDRTAFPRQLTATDPQTAVSSSDLLTALRGKDVIVAFVESYGQTAVQDSSFAPGVNGVLDSSTKTLTAAGFASRSAFLTSPTFGGLSWLAHSTLESGLWIDNQQRYNQLLDSQRFTLTDAFNKAGWRTVVDSPADVGPWPEGQKFYHFAQFYNSTNTGYHGPRFSYATMPDQFSLKAFQQLELGPGHAPVMAEFDLVSSHYPWTPLPKIVPWDAIGDGSIYDPMPAEGPTVPELYKNYDNVRASYGRSIQYSIQSLVSFVQNAHDNNLVLVLLGDHQPAPKVSGPGATHDVPISIVAHDPAVLDQISGWGWQPGLHPDPQAPVWPMDAFRDKFLTAYSSSAPTTTTRAADRLP